MRDNGYQMPQDPEDEQIIIDEPEKVEASLRTKILRGVLALVALSGMIYISGAVLGIPVLMLIGIIVFSHSSLDRIFDYGFKYHYWAKTAIKQTTNPQKSPFLFAFHKNHPNQNVFCRIRDL